MGARPDAIARAYRAFAVPVPASLGVCTACCMDPALERAMLRKEPADLTLHEVREWLDAAFGGGMAEQQVAWIMPRILELLAEGHEVATAGNEVALRRLRDAGFPGSGSRERLACVTAACHVILDRHIDARKPYLDDVLCMIANGGLPIAPYIARLDALPGDRLADLLHADWTHVNGLTIWRTAFWYAVPGRQVVWDWYTSADLETRMWQAGSAGNMRAIEVAECIARNPAMEPPD